jgi:hypothetical protein
MGGKSSARNPQLRLAIQLLRFADQRTIMLTGCVLQNTAFASECEALRARVDSPTAVQSEAGAQIQARLWGPGAPDRQLIEDFITLAYEREFGASVEVNYPILIGLCDRVGRIRAGVGMRMANREKLFLEQYLHLPVEVALSQKLFHRVERNVIVELGSFASAGLNMSLYLCGAAAAYLETRGFEFGLVTATEKMNRLFKMFDIHTQAICPAQKHDLLDQAVNWGTYYSCNPKVIVGSVQQCLAAVLKSGTVQNNSHRRATLYSIINQISGQA